ncbi:hypothetical protein JCM6882_004452 [Rhodosporidiobolus microsporus]
MLDRLPPELLSDILELAAPLDYSLVGFNDRSRTLRSCCLVNRQLCALAQPLLSKVVRVDDIEGVRALAERAEDTGFFQDTPTVIFSQIHGLPLDEVIDLEKFPSLERLSLGGGALSCTLALQSLASLSNLRHLTLIQLFTVDASSMPCIFPHLVELSIHEVVENKDEHWGIADLLRSGSDKFPALRSLALGARSLDDPSRPYIVPSTLLDQLDALQVNVLDPPDARVFAHPVPTLYLLDFVALDARIPVPPSAAHVLIGDIHNHQYFDYPCVPKTLRRRFNYVLEEVLMCTGVETLFLPFTLHPSAPITDQFEAVTLERRTLLLKTCAAKGIDVRWRHEAFSADNALTFCLDFLPLARELKAKQRATVDEVEEHATATTSGAGR